MMGRPDNAFHKKTVVMSLLDTDRIYLVFLY